MTALIRLEIFYLLSLVSCSANFSFRYAILCIIAYFSLTTFIFQFYSKLINLGMVLFRLFNCLFFKKNLMCVI